MDRRKFLKLGTAAAGISIISPYLSIAGGAGSLRLKDNSLSLEIITDMPEKAIEYISAVLPKFNHHPLTFTEYEMPGSYMGDIVLINNHKLINIYKDDSQIADAFRDAASKLKLPRTIENPSLLSFKNRNGKIEPEFVSIYLGNHLLERHSVFSDEKSISVIGSKGKMEFHLSNQELKAIDSSCRHKTCINRGSVNRSGQSIICVPNNIRAVIEGNENNGIDAETF